MRRLLSGFLFLGMLAIPAMSYDSANESEFRFARVQFSQREYRPYFLEAPWHHDYPFSEEFLTAMLRELTSIHTAEDSYEIVDLESPEIFNFPFLYFSEPGFLELTDREIGNLGEYIRRGGFIMADDFRTAAYLRGPEELDVLRHYLQLAVPEFKLVRLDIHNSIFHTFYDIDTLDIKPPYGEEIPGFVPEFWGLVDDRNRVHLIANYNNDLGEFWEWLDKGDKPFGPSVHSVQLGIDYVMYAMTH
jgi:hypothetical protein